MSVRTQRILSAVLLVTAAAVAFAWVQLDNVAKSIQFDLRKIGESLYEAHSKSGRWPSQIADLEGTQYLNMPHRRRMLEEGFFAVVWPENLDSNPKTNHKYVLAYDQGSLLSRLGVVWVCRGDLRTERIGAEEAKALGLRRRR